jgi:hypothetical protein
MSDLTVTVKLRWDGCRLIGPHGHMFGSVWRERLQAEWSAENFERRTDAWHVYKMNATFATEDVARAAVEAAATKALKGDADE